MTREGHPPVRELLPFDEAWLESVSKIRYRVIATGTAPGDWPEYAIEAVDEPSIPEPEWFRCEVVGYHWADYPPAPTDYRASAEFELPPGAVGFELIGQGQIERLPVIFEAGD